MQIGYGVLASCRYLAIFTWADQEVCFVPLAKMEPIANMTLVLLVAVALYFLTSLELFMKHGARPMQVV